MTYQFPEHYLSVSERLSHILDNVGYSQEDRNRKVKAANDAEVFHNIADALKRINSYIFGSRGEGSTGPGFESDSDHLFHFLDRQAVTELSQCQQKMTNYLMVKDSHTHPGYVKLQQIKILPDSTPVPVYKERDYDIITIDSLRRIVLPSTAHHALSPGSVSGPANHVRNDYKEFSLDSVHAWKCPQWPQEGYEWFLRRRMNGWPTPIQIENARKYGCFVTPVGDPHSTECHVEWRLSFSVAERAIVRSFDDVTMKVYILLKMIRKTYIEPIIGKAFSSYHCKVCILWMRERLPNELWRNQNILQCLVLCIRQLYGWATAGFCPDYFIVKNNIYDRKIIGTVRNNLVQILRNILSSNCTFLLRIKCCNLGQHMSGQMSGFDDCIRPIGFEEFVNHMSVVEAAYICRSEIMHSIPQQYSTLVDILDTLIDASNHLPYSMQYPVKHVQMTLWSQLGFHIATICKENAHIFSGEQINYLVALASSCLSLGINSDITSVRLKLCGIGMEIGNPNLIETSLQHIIDYHTKYIFSASALYYCTYDANLETLHRKRYNTEELLQTQTSFSVVFLPTEMSITPKPLRMEMFKSVGSPSRLKKVFNFRFDWCVVDSRMCLYFFQYLNFRRGRKDRHKQIAIDNMTHVIKNMRKAPRKHTEFNLLGYSFIKEYQLNNAFRCFVKSVNIHPHHNAAILYLGIIFNRIHTTDRGYTL